VLVAAQSNPACHRQGRGWNAAQLPRTQVPGLERRIVIDNGLKTRAESPIR